MKTKQQVEERLELLKTKLYDTKQKQKLINDERGQELFNNIREQSFLRTEIMMLEWVLSEDN